ncbi:hypothetical protein [Chamaesiphon minutus]|uniref:Uncharacterized protein n=1 Tax=Chamaesiphon minutus (strain ATCC 27169 / PCC 6605) TaxID=1173020 RepID=K9UKT8_CHAP6|nr:hypothetical protein [Chamaesiphon minutus]AFY95076.1 hypothetical protein Cha6605_4127 [Chamaesiphon minutus PCC 6605]
MLLLSIVVTCCISNEDYRAAAADLVNRWEQDRKVTASDELPLSLEIEDAWIFATVLAAATIFTRLRAGRNKYLYAVRSEAIK